MDLTQLQKLGISLPPAKAFSVDMSPHEREIIAFWLMSRIAGGRTVTGVKTTAATVTAAAANILPVSDVPRMLILQNLSDTLNIWIAFNATATQSLGLKIPPNGYYESPFDFTEFVSAIGTGSTPVTIITCNR